MSGDFYFWLGASADADPATHEPSPSSTGLGPSGEYPLREEPYENTLTVDELRREVRELWDRELAFTRDLRDLPEVPSLGTMRLLSSAAMNMHGTLERGKELQFRARHMMRQETVDGFDLGFSGVPWKCEYECGAGLWTILCSAIAAERPA